MTMTQQPKPRLVLVEREGEPNSEFSFFRARRLRKYGPPPSKPSIRGTPLVRERLATRSIAAVIETVIHPPEIVFRARAVLTMIAIMVVLFVLCLAGTC